MAVEMLRVVTTGSGMDGGFVLRGRFFLRRLDFCLLRPFGYGKALVAAAEENQESEK